MRRLPDAKLGYDDGDMKHNPVPPSTSRHDHAIISDMTGLRYCQLVTLLLIALTTAACHPKPADVLLPEDGSKDFHVIVLTDTQWMLEDAGRRFEPVASRVNAAMPDFVVVLGDIISQPSDTAKAYRQQLDRITKVYDQIRVPKFYIAGPGERTTDWQQKIWKKKVGPPWYTWKYKSNRFIALSLGEATSPSCMSDGQVRWLSEQLNLVERNERVYIFINESLWLMGQTNNPGHQWLSTIHPMLAQLENATVIAGGFQQYSNVRHQDGVNYLTVGLSGVEIGGLHGQWEPRPYRRFNKGDTTRTVGRFDLPKLSRIKIDGNSTDWFEQGANIEAMVPVTGTLQSAGDFQPRIRLGWDDQGLVMTAEIRDDVLMVEATAEDALTPLAQRDSLQLEIKSKAGQYQLQLAPALIKGRPAARLELKKFELNKLDGQQWVEIPGQVEVACLVGRNGYLLEMRLPWASVGMKGDANLSFDFQLQASDIDNQSKPTKLRWSIGGKTINDTAPPLPKYYKIKLVPDKQATMQQWFTQYKRLGDDLMQIKLTANQNMAGKLVFVTTNNPKQTQPIARGVMIDDHNLTHCTLIFHLPTGQPTTALLKLWLDKKLIDQFQPGPVKNTTP